ncbi:tetratricopeptide repeat protein [Treponema bryantii]|uniref:tetratricopeptide repeat protein n=1 Tax=Treponema bryantii TaxID=163 RepID=UPI002B2C966E|nr:hypothetical protein TRBR_25220 [Treponema bryantii]
MANSLNLAKAQNAITAHDWTTAARLYKEMLRGDEGNVEYLQQLGSIYVRAGQDEKAIPYYEQIITVNPENTDAMVSLGGIFRRLKRYEDSVNILHKAQESSANNPSVNYSIGFTYKEMGAYDDAIDAFESVISRNPDDVLAHNHLGAIYFAKKDYNTAIATYKRGLQVDQNHPILNYNLAHVYEDIKNFPEAVRCYETALKTRPGWLEAIRDFSELLIRCQETKQAQELVEQSIKLHPDDVDLLCILGRIYLNQFDYDNATKTFKRAESLKNNDINILLGLSKSLEKGMKIEPAMEKIVDAVGIEPENLDVCKQYSHVLLSAQRYDKALDVIKKIDEKSDGKDLQILDLYGQYFVCRGDEEAAETYFNKIRKINHHYKDYMINAADRYIQTGNYEKAEEMANKFVESRPNMPEGYNLLGTISTARGELNKAKAEYEKGLSLKNPNIYAVKQLEKIHSEMEANKEIYNDEEMPIAVDADTLPEEEGGNLTESGSLIDNDENTADQVDALLSSGSDEEDELPDIGSLEATPPIEQALSGEDGEFWEDFDDDPDAVNKPLIDEEDEAYDENSEDSDLMTMMTPDAAETGNDLKSGLSEDAGDFDFGDFEDGGIVDQEEETAAEPEASDVSEAEPEIPESKAETSVPVAGNPVVSPEAPAAESEQPMFEPDSSVVEPEFAEQNASSPVSMPEAQQMMQDLKNQQKELELQQRELALQQKELADELKQENEKMIQQTVEKAVEEAVEEKLSAYDLQPEPVADETVVEEPFVEEPVFDETVTAEEPVVENEPVVEEDAVVENEPVFEESAIDDFVEEPVFEKESVVEEPIVEAESDAENEPIFEDSIIEEESVDETPVVDETIEDDMDILTSDPFVTVDEMSSLFGDDFYQSPAPVIEESNDEPLSDENFVTADDMIDKIGRILNDDEMKKSCSAELELFKTLRTLAGFLPEKEKNSFDCCRMRMVIEYIIQKMSGKPGLLITAESLIKSGVLGEEYNRQLEDCCDEELSNDLIRHVITDMKKLAQGLEDRELCNALCVSADGILEQIALIDQKVAIF